MLTMRWAVRFGVVFGVVAGIAVYGVLFLPSEAQQEDRVIPIHASKFTEPGIVEEGDGCSISVDDPLSRLGTREQIVVKDETDTIIALATLEGGTWEQAQTPGKLECNIDIELSVPTAEFYTVYLGDERIRAYTADSFPLNDPFDVVRLSFV